MVACQAFSYWVWCGFASIDTRARRAYVLRGSVELESKSQLVRLGSLIQKIEPSGKTPLESGGWNEVSVLRLGC
jgi:hypothetical protein